MAFRRIVNLCVGRHNGHETITEADVSRFAGLGYLPDLAALQGACSFAPGCLEALKAAEFSAITGNLFYVTRLKQFLKRLAEHRIEPVLLKGIALQFLQPERTKTRDMTDIDLLVQPEDAARLLAIAEEAGFRRDEREPSLEKFSLKAADRDHSIDVTTDLYKKALLRTYFTCSSASAFERRVPLPIGSLSAYVLSPEDEVLYFIVHLAFHIHFLITPKWLIDLYFTLLRPQRPLDRAYLGRTVAEFGIQRPVYAYSRLLEYLFGEPVWSHFAARAPRIGWLDRAWLTFMIFPPRLLGWRYAKSALLKRTFSTLFRYALLPRPSQKLHFLARHLLRAAFRAWQTPGSARLARLLKPRVMLETALLPLTAAATVVGYLALTAYVVAVCRGFPGLQEPIR